MDEILLIRERIPPDDLARLARVWSGTMVKLVADVRREVIAVGGGLHADAEARLIEDGSLQEDLWGANYYPGRGPSGCVEYTSLINIRPAAGNPGMEVADKSLRSRVRDLVHRLIGTGEEAELDPGN